MQEDGGAGGGSDALVVPAADLLEQGGELRDQRRAQAAAERGAAQRKRPE